MGVSTSEVGYTSATTGRGDNEVHKGHVVALKKKSCLKMVVKPKHVACIVEHNKIFARKIYITTD
jgi:hypothetical protein